MSPPFFPNISDIRYHSEIAKAAAMENLHRHRLVVAVVRKSTTAIRHGAAIVDN